MKLFTERMNEMIVESTQNTLWSFFENPTQSAFIVPVSLFEVSMKRKTEWRNEEQKNTYNSTVRDNGSIWNETVSNNTRYFLYVALLSGETISPPVTSMCGFVERSTTNIFCISCHKVTR